MKTRTEIINEIIKKKRYCSYLEIGLGNGENFENIVCLFKTGVDPVLPNINRDKNSFLFNMDSNYFFTNIHEKYDIIFIDGLHHAEQVERDVINGWNFLNQHGMLLLHDCIPYTEMMQWIPRMQIEWTGNVWRACIGFKAVYENKIKTSLLDEYYGIFAIHKSKNEISCGFVDWKTTYKEFSLNKHKYLGEFEKE